jgi:hypothetical protein
MPRFLRLVLQLALIITGVLVAWPQIRGWVMLQRAPGVVLEVFPRPLPNGMVALAVAYEFRLPKPGGGQVSYLSYQLADDRFRPLAGDPQVEPHRVEEVVRAWLDLDEDGRRYRTVFFDPKDPANTAMLPDKSGQRPRNRMLIGALLAAAGMLWFMVAGFRRDPIWP